MGVRMERERGETGLEQVGEEGMGETGKVVDSDWLGLIEVGPWAGSVGVVSFSMGATRQEDRSEIYPDKEDEFGSVCKAFGVSIASVAEVSGDLGEDGTDIAEEGMCGRELGDGEGKGEVMRETGEGGDRRGRLGRQ